jgi:hypothetical protein
MSYQISQLNLDFPTTLLVTMIYIALTVLLLTAFNSKD